jgi:hypothetical protein
MFFHVGAVHRADSLLMALRDERKTQSPTE